MFWASVSGLVLMSYNSPRFCDLCFVCVCPVEVIIVVITITIIIIIIIIITNVLADGSQP